MRMADGHAWEQRELPVLRAIVLLYERSIVEGDSPGPYEVSQVTGMSQDEVTIAAVALKEAGLIALKENRGNDRLLSWRVVGVSTEARQLLDRWPAASARPESIPSERMYVQASVLDELRASGQASRWNCEKLLRFSEELNACFALQHRYACHMLIRAILDHVPPLFGHSSFDSVASEYAWPRTDRRYMIQLRQFKAQADDALHRQISSQADVLTLDDLPPAPAVNRLLVRCASLLTEGIAG